MATGALGFAVAAAAMTLPELVAGRSLGGGDRQTTLFGGQPRDPGDAAPTTTSATAPASETATETTPASATETTPAPEQEPEYQPRQRTMPQTAPRAQPTEPRPASTETIPGSAPRP